MGIAAPARRWARWIRVGNDLLFSGEWWITIWPGLALVLIALSVNLLAIGCAMR